VGHLTGQKVRDAGQFHKQKEKHGNEEINSEIFTLRGQKRRNRDESHEERQTEERAQRQDRQKPETGNRDRTFQSQKGGQESSSQGGLGTGLPENGPETITDCANGRNSSKDQYRYRKDPSFGLSSFGLE
jgi:hypothetical protein